ncbi:Polyketide cyclase/dehydrase [Penicillium bovifimosum]|uniref:Polyketide cyclase/dehydrase n=1 Tax=Penicillium bovifimosum TaxID=126998 RepID=A0A9W9H509_9EURO|nr:Polyketide cyclase/dehydrase [Penicillium bovifimosum]KAJ5138759.1 Polyketide cyclase/dehydrase [Penicillium bovifimosum]
MHALSSSYDVAPPLPPFSYIRPPRPTIAGKMISSTIEIDAPPSKVRELLLNFSAYPEWHTEWLKSIKVQDSTKTSKELVWGDKIEINIQNFKFVAEIRENTESLFSWQGPPVLTIAGLYKFHMEPANGGASTVFTQTEDPKGLLAFIMSPSLLGNKVRANFDIFLRDLKARAEQA